VRVLCIGTDYPPPGAGGYERQCGGFVAHLRRHGHEVLVLTGAGPSHEPDRDVQRVLPRFPVEPVPVPREHAWRDERRSRDALRSALAARPDAVCFWRLGELSMSIVARVRRAGIPAVGMVCDPWMIDGPRREPMVRRPRGRSGRRATCRSCACGSSASVSSFGRSWLATRRRRMWRRGSGGRSRRSSKRCRPGTRTAPDRSMLRSRTTTPGAA
jgi:hypothetical protein